MSKTRWTARRPAGRWSARLQALTSRRKRSRGAAELSVVVVTASLIAGVIFGSGLTRTAVDVADGLTWITDGPSGEVIQVNPATGRPEVRLDVGDDGDALDIAQYDGRLIVTNRTTGELTSFDLASILASGQQRVSTGGATDVLHHDGRVYLIDRSRGTISDIDPVTTDAIGEIWTSPEGIADAAIDGTGRVWAIDEKGLLTELRWSPGSQEFAHVDDRTIENSGGNSVLVGHERGVTVFGPDAGIVVQVGTGHDVVADAARLSGELEAPSSSPADLVPVSSPSTGMVAIVGQGMVREIGVAAIGCRQPGRPEVFQGLVYVPCPGDGKVVRLAPDGHRADADIDVADNGDPDLVVDDGNLIINVPGAPNGAIVHADGTVASIVRYDDSIPATPTGTTADPPLPPTTQSVTTLAHHDSTPPSVAPGGEGTPPGAGPGPGDGGPGGGGPGACSQGSTTCGPPSSPPSGSPSPEGPGAGTPTTDPDAPQPLQAPTGVTAVELPSGSVQVTWHHGGDPADSFQVQEPNGPPLVSVSGSERQTSVSVPPGSHRFTVTAIRDREPHRTSAPSNAVTTSGRPSGVANIRGHVTGNPNDTTASVTFSWDAAADNGSPVLDYTIVATDSTGGQTIVTAGTTAGYTAVCETTYCNPGPVTVAITARNANGQGPTVSGTLAYDGPEPPALPAANQQLVDDDSTTWQGTSLEGIGSTRLTLDAPADWADFTGTCSWTHTGNQKGSETATYSCDADEITVRIENGYARAPDNGIRRHSIVFTASNGVESITSATYAWETRQRTLCDRCQIP
ncbi:MAG: hypothetical protein JWO76_235 [Nocardioides sp.]|nr:hypothetical protein [Nocardioides sp.]